MRLKYIVVRNFFISIRLYDVDEIINALFDNLLLAMQISLAVDYSNAGKDFNAITGIISMNKV